MFKFNTDNIGYFVEKELKNEFTYRLTKNEWALHFGLIHEIDVGLGVRFGLVKKTVCLIAIDEDNGNPVIEKWKLSKNVNCSFIS